MADEEEIIMATDEKRWRHPRRIVGAAFLMGTALGMAAMAAKGQHQEKSFWQKITS